MRQLCKFEKEIGGKLYEFYCEPNSPISHVKESIAGILGEVISIENAMKEAAEKLAETKVEEPTAEVPDGI